MDKKSFVKYMKILKKYCTFETHLSKEGLNLFEVKAVSDLIQAYQDLISYCVDDAINQKYFYSDLSYFIYDLEWGSRYEPGMITDSDGNQIDFSSIEKLYKYFKANYKSKQNTVNQGENEE